MHGGCGAITCTLQTSSPAPHIRIMPPRGLIKLHQPLPTQPHLAPHTHTNSIIAGCEASYMHGKYGAITYTLHTPSPAPHIHIMPPPRPYKGPPASTNTATSGPPHPHHQPHNQLWVIIHAWGVWGHHMHTSGYANYT